LGWLRFLPLGQVASPEWGGMCIVGGMLAAFFGVLVGVCQTNPKTVLAYSRLCWVSLHSTQPTFCRCYCEMRNPTTLDFGTESQKFIFRLNWWFFWPAAALNTDTPGPDLTLHESGR
ncbi:MAG: hypothetical protein AB1Z31_17725, partial [Desulfobacterales bacterium]